MASIAQLGIKYCNLQLDELEKAITRETDCLWSKFGPHIPRLSVKITKLASLGDVSALEQRVEQFKTQLMQRTFESLQNGETELKVFFLVTVADTTPYDPQTTYKQVLTFAAEAERFTEDCPTFPIEGTYKSILAFKSRMETYWALYRNGEPIPEVSEVPVHILSVSISQPAVKIHGQIGKLREKINNDKECFPAKYRPQLEELGQSITVLHSNSDGSLPCRFEFLRQDLRKAQSHLIQHSVSVVDATIRKYLADPSRCRFAQCRAIKKEIRLLEAQSLFESASIAYALAGLTRSQQSLLATVTKSYEKHAATRSRKPTVNLDSLENWRLQRPSSTDSGSSTRSCRHFTDSESDTRSWYDNRPKGKYVCRVKREF